MGRCGELQFALDLDFGVQLSLQLALVVVLEAGCMRYIVEHGLHGSRIERGSSVKGLDGVPLGIADRTEACVALETRIELVGLVQILMHTMQHLFGGQRPRRDVKRGGWRRGGRVLTTRGR